MNCATCGAPNRENSRFCLSCGSRMGSSSDAPTARQDEVPLAPMPSVAPRRFSLWVGVALGATVALVAVGLFVLVSGGDTENTSPPSETAESRIDDSDQGAEVPLVTQATLQPAEVTPVTSTTTTLPATTAVPATATASTEPTGFPFPNAFEVPQLGYEPVRGTGCGADASIGDVIPDGWWFGGVEDITSASLRLDLVCAYFGDEAAARIADCAATEDYGVCTSYWGEQFWPVNNTERYRVVPADDGLVRVVDSTMGCSLADIDRGRNDELSWVRIVNGRAVHVQHLCPAG